jgi:cell division protein ZapA (FtsZ GTPase activity inhibitor)
MSKKYDVNIAGYALTVKTDRSAEHMERLSELLNGRVREVQKSGVTANYLHVVMLAAMKLADEILDLRTGRTGEKGSEEKEQSALDSALEKEGPVAPVVFVRGRLEPIQCVLPACTPSRSLKLSYPGAHGESCSTRTPTSAQRRAFPEYRGSRYIVWWQVRFS